MFERMLDHPNIDIELGLDYHDVRSACDYDKLVFTGPIDEYFDYRFGKLPYRSLQFRHETVNQEWFQSVAVVNYPDPETAHTRITEYKHLTGQANPKTSITYERSEEHTSELQSLMRISYAVFCLKKKTKKNIKKKRN